MGIEWSLKEGEKLVQIFSRITGKPLEVPEYMARELEEFEASARGHVLRNYSSKPLEPQETHYGMLRLGEATEADRIDRKTRTEADLAEAERQKLLPPPINPTPGQDWKDLVG